MADIVSLMSTGELFTALPSVSPAIYPAGTINGPIIDRLQSLMPKCLLVSMTTGAVAGGPTAVSITAEVMTSQDRVNWSPITDASGATITQTLSSANSQAVFNASLLMASRFVQMVYTVSLAGGTSPTIAFSAAQLVAGGNQLVQ